MATNDTNPMPCNQGPRLRWQASESISAPVSPDTGPQPGAQGDAAPEELTLVASQVIVAARAKQHEEVVPSVACSSAAGARGLCMQPGVRMDAHSGLRGLMALHVAVFHYLCSPQVKLNTHGNAHMPFFFMLSGFSLAVVYGQRASIDRYAFWRNRFSRCMPLVYLCHALVVPAGMLGFGHASPDMWLATLRHNVFATSMWVLHDGEALAWGWNGPAWTVSTLVAYYWVFPLLNLGALARLGARVSAGVSVRVALGVICAACSAHGLHGYVLAQNTQVSRAASAAILVAALLIGAAAATSGKRADWGPFRSAGADATVRGACATIGMLSWLQLALGLAMGWGGLPYIGSGYWPATGWVPSRLPIFLMGCLAGVYAVHEPAVEMKAGRGRSSRAAWARWTDGAATLYCGTLVALTMLRHLFPKDSVFGTKGPWMILIQLVMPYVQLVLLVGLARSDASVTARVCLSKAAQRLGKVSMALYLVHMPVKLWLAVLANGPQEWLPADMVNRSAPLGPQLQAFHRDCHKNRDAPTEECTRHGLSHDVPPTWIPMMLVLALAAALMLEKHVETPLRNKLRLAAGSSSALLTKAPVTIAPVSLRRSR